MDKENKKPIVNFEPGSRQPFILYLISITIISSIIVIACLFSSGISKTEVKKDSSLGDVDLNGTINMADAKLLTEYLTGLIKLTAEQLKEADADKNGSINTHDSMVIFQTAESLGESTDITTSQATAPSSTQGHSETSETEESSTTETSASKPEIESDYVSEGKGENAAFCTSESGAYYVARITNSWKDATGRYMYQISLTVKNNTEKTIYNTSADVVFNNSVVVEKQWDCSIKNEESALTVKTKNDESLSPGGTFTCGFIISSNSAVTINSIVK